MQVLSANGVSKVTAEVGQQMDPNLHEAMFDIPNPDAEPGSIAIIVKVSIRLLKACRHCASDLGKCFLLLACLLLTMQQS